MMIECLTISQAQLGEELSGDSGDLYTLQTDGTTSILTHVKVQQLKTQSYSLGLRHVFSGSAQDTLETLAEMLDDLDVVRKEVGQCSVSSSICIA